MSGCCDVLLVVWCLSFVICCGVFAVKCVLCVVYWLLIVVPYVIVNCFAVVGFCLLFDVCRVLRVVWRVLCADCC